VAEGEGGKDDKYADRASPVNEEAVIAAVAGIVQRPVKTTALAAVGRAMHKVEKQHANMN
jgi:hypothetical protein